MCSSTYNCTYVPLSHYNWKTVNISCSCYGIYLAFNPTVYCIYTAFLAITLWVAFGLLLKIISTFRSRNTMYFWSLTVTTCAIIVRSIGLNIQFVSGLPNSTFQSTIHTLSWATMVTGSSLILYSRLHLLLPSPRLLRSILFVILGTGVLFHTPNIVMAYVAGSTKPAMQSRFAHIFAPFDIVFSAQEVLLSSMYICLFVRFTRQGDCKVPQNARKVLYLLLVVEVVIIISHTIVNVLLFLKLYLARRMVLGLVYALQIKIEFVVLNSFMAFSKERQADLGVRGAKLDSRLIEADTPRVLRDLYLNKSRVLGTKPQQEISVLKPVIISSSSLDPGSNVCSQEDVLDELERKYLGRLKSTSAV